MYMSIGQGLDMTASTLQVAEQTCTHTSICRAWQLCRSLMHCILDFVRVECCSAVQKGTKTAQRPVKQHIHSGNPIRQLTLRLRQSPHPAEATTPHLACPTRSPTLSPRLMPGHHF